MLALVLDEGPRLEPEYPRPEPHAGEVLLGMRLAGVCDTDMQLVQGYLGFRGVLGHEAVAEVLDAEDKSWLGRRVVVDINAGCGSCNACGSGNQHHCPHRTVLGIAGRDGVFAEYFRVPSHCLVLVPDLVPDEKAVFAEPLAAAIHVLEAVDPEFVDQAIVVGDGKLGLLIGMVLSRVGIQVTQFGHHPNKLELLLPYGVRPRLESGGTVGVRRAPLVVEATGSERGLGLAMSLVEPRGTLVLKTTTAHPTTVALAPLVVDEVALVGSRCGNLEEAIDWLARGRIDPTPLIAARYPLSHADDAIAHAATRGVLKVLIAGTGAGAG